MKKLILETKVLSELNRMREIMGLNLITESTVDELLKLLGIDAKTVDNLTKAGVDLSDLSKLSDEFARLGITDVATFKAAVGSLDATKGFGDEALSKFIRSNKQLMSDIADSISKQTADYVKGFLNDADVENLLGQNTARKLEDLLTKQVTPGEESQIIGDLKNYMNATKILIDDIRSGKYDEYGVSEVPQALDELYTSLETRVSTIEKLTQRIQEPDYAGIVASRTADEEMEALKKETEELERKMAEEAKMDEFVKEMQNWLKGTFDPIYKKLNNKQKKSLLTTIEQAARDGEKRKAIEVIGENELKKAYKVYKDADKEFWKKVNNLKEFGKDAMSWKTFLFVVGAGSLLGFWKLGEVIGWFGGSAGGSDDVKRTFKKRQDLGDENADETTQVPGCPGKDAFVAAIMSAYGQAYDANKLSFVDSTCIGTYADTEKVMNYKWENNDWKALN